MVTLNGELITRQIFGQFRDEAAKVGRHLELGEDLAWGGGLYLAARSKQPSMASGPTTTSATSGSPPSASCATPTSTAEPWGTPGAPAGVPTIEEGVRQKAWLVGPPSRVIAQLRELEAEYPGLEHIVLHWPEGMSAPDWQHQLTVFAQEVMPAFQPVAAASSRF